MFKEASASDGETSGLTDRSMSASEKQLSVDRLKRVYRNNHCCNIYDIFVLFINIS